MKNVIYIAASIDGFIASPDGTLDWLTGIPNPSGSDYGFADFMDGVDGIVMGRNTYETVLSFGEWPYIKRVFVLSHTLKAVDASLRGKAEIIHGDPAEVVRELNERGYSDLYVDGGKTIQGFLEEDLIDEMIITRASIILGGGIPLFGPSDKARKFKVVSAEILNGDLVKTRFIRVRD